MPNFEIRLEPIGGNAQIGDVNAILRSLQQAQNLYAGQVIRRGRNYPPERPNQKYKRTLKLKREWHIQPSRRVGDSMEVSITNTATDTARKRPKQYAGFVFGFDVTGKGQSSYHVGRWPTQAGLINVESYQRQMQNAIDRAVNTGGVSGL